MRKLTPLFLSLVLLCGSVSRLQAARDDERMAQLKDQIHTLDTMVAASKDGPERTRLEAKQDRLKQELKILDERQLIESKQKELSEDLAASPVDALRERLRSIEVGAEDGEARLREIAVRRKAVAAERDALADQIAELRSKAGKESPALGEKVEKQFTRNEELRLLSLQREAAEASIDLSREADRLREELKGIELASGPSLKALYESYSKIGDGGKAEARLMAILANVEQNLKICESTVELSQLKLAKFDEELALLEKQTGFFRTDERVEKLLVSQRNQKKAVAERAPLLVSQLEALKRTQAAQQARLDLVRLETTMLNDHFAGLKKTYIRRMSWPVMALSGIGLLYFILHYVVLRMIYRKEALLLARRLSLYAAILAGTGVVAGFLFDDLSMMATTLGVVSAGLVISLQDVCTSVFGWFVIMLGGKFSIGDRLEIEGTRGDVIDIQLLRTTLIEVNGWLDTDQPTGRVIVVPNNFIFKSKVCNYNHQHPFIWGKIDVTIAFSTPVAEAIDLFHKALSEETAEEFTRAQAGADTFRARYGVDDAVYQPRIYTKIVGSGVTLSLFFVAHYRNSSSTRNRINRRLITELEKHPQIQLANDTLQIIQTTPVPGAPAATMGSAPSESTAPFAVNGVGGLSRPPVLPGR